MDDSSTAASQIPLSLDEFRLFQAFIHREAGINMSDAKQALVSGRLTKRLRATGQSSFAAYHALIESGDPAVREERQLALDLLTTNETYFFREPKHFVFLKQEALPELKPDGLRVWSAACSSGEEAYTLAMLLDACLGQRSWEVVGTDISHRMLEQASRGRYPLTRSDRIPAPLLKKYCWKGVRSMDGVMKIDAALKQRVRFLPTNLKDSQEHLGLFDVIFLRNVMIYFDKPTKQQVLRQVLRQLKPGGFLMIGHSESLQDLTDELVVRQSSIYQKRVA